jgi:osmotically inducible lipoprotein OsmB
MNRMLLALCAAASLGLAACSSSPTKEQIGTVGGAVVGGAAGSAVSGGSNVGTIGGAAAGAIIGKEVGEELDKD